MLIDVSAFLASSIFLLLLPYLFWVIVIYGAYKAILLFAEEYKVKRATLEEPHRQLLEERFKYYRQLNKTDQKTFEKRVKAFLREKEFIARGGLNMTDEMRLLIAACAIQLTFGLPPVYLVHFKKILLYPDEYYSTINQTHHAGEVNAGGIIVLSWKHFTEGNHWPENSYNVGLHEMAHALLLENRIQNREYNFLSDESIEYFFACAEQEREQILDGECLSLRAYATTSRAEFFAVAVETFFEQPRELKAGCPQLYEALAQLLNQNPLEKRPAA